MKDTNFLERFTTPHESRTCLNCVHFSQYSQWSGACEVHNSCTDTSDRCEKWDGE